MSTALVLPREREKTFADYLQAAEDYPAMQVQLLNGEITMSPAPRPLHQIVSDNLSWLLNQYVRQHRLGRILTAPTGVKLAENQTPQPDILFIRQERIAQLIGKQSIEGPPDFIAEILSPGNIHDDRHTKMLLYAAYQVPEYWIVDPDNDVVEVYTLDGDTYRVAGIFLPDETINRGQFAEANIAINDVFSR